MKKKCIALLVMAAFLCTAAISQNVLPASGNVGINVPNPLEALDIRRTLVIRNGSLLISKDAVTDPVTIGVVDNYINIGGAGLLGETGNLVQRLGSSTWRFRNGWWKNDVHIAASLYTNASDYAGVVINGSTDRSIGFLKYPGRNSGMWRTNDQAFAIGRVGAGKLVFEETEQLPGELSVDFCIDATGNIGIGTSSPQAKLSVNGIVLARKLKINIAAADWFDHVFDSSYRLLPLQQLAAFIEKNKHLPDLPPAIQVQEKGIDLGTQWALSTKKIEELTLYIIEQEKQMAAFRQSHKEECRLLQEAISKLEILLNVK